MGEIHLQSKEQETIFSQVKNDAYLQSNFYFTGGTALSCVYLNHRYSEDLDFFSEKIKIDTQIIASLVEEWSKQNNFTYTSNFVEVVYTFYAKFNAAPPLKVDFSYYPYKRVEKGLTIDGFEIDSLLDIAINKLQTISQRTNVKDFVDLYYLLEKFSLWDLREGVRIKFRQQLEPLLLSADLLKVEDFTFLPNMIKPLTLEELQVFFREKAKELGRIGVE